MTFGGADRSSAAFSSAIKWLACRSAVIRGHSSVKDFIRLFAIVWSLTDAVHAFNKSGNNSISGFDQNASLFRGHDGYRDDAMSIRVHAVDPGCIRCVVEITGSAVIENRIARCFDHAHRFCLGAREPDVDSIVRPGVVGGDCQDFPIGGGCGHEVVPSVYRREMASLL